MPASHVTVSRSHGRVDAVYRPTTSAVTNQPTTKGQSTVKYQATPFPIRWLSRPSTTNRARQIPSSTGASGTRRNDVTATVCRVPRSEGPSGTWPQAGGRSRSRRIGARARRRSLRCLDRALWWEVRVQPVDVSRRRFLAGMGSAAAALALSSCSSGAKKVVQRAAAVCPAGRSLEAIEHVEIVMQENRSVDHYFGSYRGVRGFDDHRGNHLGAF